MVQVIGMDIGRGYVKAYSQFGGKIYSEKFASFSTMGIEQERWEADDYFISIEGVTDEDGHPVKVERQFVGDRARRKGGTGYITDSKSSVMVQTLFATALSKVAASEYVKVMLGVPDDLATKATLAEIRKAFKGKSFTITNHITNEVKEVLVEDVHMYREGQAIEKVLGSLIEGLEDYDIGIVTTGFKTTELTFIDRGGKINRDKSASFPIGNVNVLNEAVTAYGTGNLTGKREVVSPEVIDMDDRYYSETKSFYKALSEQVMEKVEEKWRNRRHMKLFVAGGTATKMGYNLGQEFKVIPSAQMATSKGLFIVGNAYFNREVI